MVTGGSSGPDPITTRSRSSHGTTPDGTMPDGTTSGSTMSGGRMSENPEEASHEMLELELRTEECHLLLSTDSVECGSSRSMRKPFLLTGGANAS